MPPNKSCTSDSVVSTGLTSWERHFVFMQLILTWPNERLTKRQQQICCWWSREGISSSLLNKLHIWLYLTGGEFVITNVLPGIWSLSDRWSPRRAVCNDLMLFAAYLARHQWVACSLHREFTKQMLMSPREKKSSLFKNKVRVSSRSKALWSHFVSSAALWVSAETLFQQALAV